jgi:hypothetical protein
VEALSPDELRQLTLDLLRAQTLKDLRLEELWSAGLIAAAAGHPQRAPIDPQGEGRIQFMKSVTVSLHCCFSHCLRHLSYAKKL